MESIGRFTGISLISTWTGFLRLLVSASTLCAAACSQAPTPETPAGANDPHQPELTSRFESENNSLPELEGESGVRTQRAVPRRVGDIFVHRFSGSYRGSALTLREEVIGESAETLIVDYLLNDEGSLSHLRVEITKGSERIVRVARVVGEEELPATLKEYDAMMAKTTFVPDSNLGQVAKKDQTCLVGQDEFACAISEFSVQVGDQSATLAVAHSQSINRDISGEITAVDGTVIYRASLIEMHQGQEKKESAASGVALNR